MNIRRQVDEQLDKVRNSKRLIVFIGFLCVVIFIFARGAGG